jgi:HD-GYP domain-containing protein (c-di-GMP phosphodiesterase class II)
MNQLTIDPLPLLVISSSPYMRGILKFIIEGQLTTNVTELESEEKALIYVKNLNQQIGMIVYDYVPDAYLLEDFIIFLKQHSNNVKIIVLIDKIRDESRELFKDFSQILLLDEYELPFKLIDETVKKSPFSHFVNKSEYCRIDINFLSILDGINKNLFLKLGEEKFVKVFNEDDLTDQLDLTKYKQRGIEYFYLKRETSSWLLEQIKKQIDIFLKSNNFRFVLRGANETPEKKFEQKILRISDEVHIEKEFREEIDKVVEKIRRSLTQEKRVENYFKNLKENSDHGAFFNNKMYLCSLISCALARELEWISNVTMDKLVYASVVCDLTLAVRPELLALKNVKDFNQVKNKFSNEDQNIFLNHPKDASFLVKSYFKMAPPETDAIIYQHHEFPDGSGFPVGLKADKISPLSALFIVANDFSYYFLTDDDPSMDDFILKSHSKYDFVNFRKVIQALIKIRRKII